ncbi:hypothetical protein C8R45DRAFT_1215747 [Mycena sanguinolenta]|nr:hypothetical protein C8R45DRAFT_1215747 [Mycena sanguinolenta]
MCTGLLEPYLRALEPENSQPAPSVPSSSTTMALLKFLHHIGLVISIPIEALYIHCASLLDCQYRMPESSSLDSCIIRGLALPFQISFGDVSRPRLQIDDDVAAGRRLAVDVTLEDSTWIQMVPVSASAIQADLPFGVRRFAWALLPSPLAPAVPTPHHSFLYVFYSSPPTPAPPSSLIALPHFCAALTILNSGVTASYYVLDMKPRRPVHLLRVSEPTALRRVTYASTRIYSSSRFQDTSSSYSA